MNLIRARFEVIKIRHEAEGQTESEAAINAAKELRHGVSQEAWDDAFSAYPIMKPLPGAKLSFWVRSLTYKHFVRNMSFPLS